LLHDFVWYRDFIIPSLYLNSHYASKSRLKFSSSRIDEVARAFVRDDSYVGWSTRIIQSAYNRRARSRGAFVVISHSPIVCDPNGKVRVIIRHFDEASCARGYLPFNKALSRGLSKGLLKERARIRSVWSHKFMLMYVAHKHHIKRI
jgi:hypothetical protein